MERSLQVTADSNLGGFIVKPFSAALLGATLLLIAAPANAADVYDGDGGLKDAAPLPWPTNIWAGFYLGGHIGSTFEDELVVDGLAGDVDEALAGGIHAGYNWQRGTLVYGLETDFGVIDDEFQGDAVTSYLATVRARLGYAFGNTLAYGTGGLALLSFDEEIDDGDFDDPSVGFVVGGGLEHKFSPNWSLGVEGLYYEIDSDIEGSDGEVERDFFVVRARATYHLQR